PTEGRRRETRKLLEEVVKLRRKLGDAAVAERFDPEIRGLVAESGSMLDQQETLVEVTNQFPLLWPVAIHPDGKRLAVASSDRPIAWAPDKSVPVLQKLDAEKPPRLWYSPDGTYLLFAPASGGLEVWDAAAERKLKTVQSSAADRVLAVGFAQD